MLLYLSFFLLLVKTNGLTAFGKSKIDNNCDGNKHPGIWECVQNVHGTLNVTYDCAINNHGHYIVMEMKLWSAKYPHNMQSLTIQNCETLFLDISDRYDHSGLLNFTQLRAVNISNFRVIRYKGNTRNKIHSYSYHFYDDEDGTSTGEDLTESIERIENIDLYQYLAKHLVHEEKPSGRLPSDVTFQNIKSLDIEDTLLHREPPKPDTTLESFKIINATIKHLHSNFLGETHALKQLIFDNVIVLKLENGTISFQNKEGVVKIINSTFDLTLETFLNCNVSKVIVTGNTFKELSKHAFKCRTDEFVFSGNKIESLLNPLDEDDWESEYFPSSTYPANSALLINSTVVNIQGNIIHNVASSAFAGIIAPKSDKTLNSPHRIFNFLNNQIYNLEPHSLIFQEGKDGVMFDSMSIANNSINCSCHNIPWFVITAKQRFDMQKNAFYVTKKSNQNRCSNIPNCSLGQVMYNFYELCEPNYICPANVSGDSFGNRQSTFMIFEENFKTILEASVDSADSNKKMLKIAMNENEEKKSLFGNFSKILKHLSRTSGVEKGLIKDEQSIIVTLLVIITSCILVILILNCFVIGYSKMIGYVKSPCLIARYNRHDNAETELMGSRMSLNL